MLPFGYPDERIRAAFLPSNPHRVRGNSFSAYGKVTVWIDGKKAIPECQARQSLTA